MISDEQVQIALKVWFQDDEYEGGAASLRDMRAALEAAVGDCASPAADADGWFTNSWNLERGVHGTFFIGRLRSEGGFHANRVYADASGERGLGCESLGYEFPTFADAKAAVARRIAELDAAVPAVSAELAQVSP